MKDRLSGREINWKRKQWKCTGHPTYKPNVLKRFTICKSKVV